MWSCDRVRDCMYLVTGGAAGVVGVTVTGLAAVG